PAERIDFGRKSGGSTMEIELTLELGALIVGAVGIAATWLSHRSETARREQNERHHRELRRMHEEHHRERMAALQTVDHASEGKCDEPNGREEIAIASR